MALAGRLEGNGASFCAAFPSDFGDADFSGAATRVFLAPCCIVGGDEGSSGLERFLLVPLPGVVRSTAIGAAFFLAAGLAGEDVRSTVRFFGAGFLAGEDLVAFGAEGSRCGRAGAGFWRMKPGILAMGV